MRRGDVVTVATAGDYGKPRPAVIVTADILLNQDHDAIAICQLTSTLNDLADYRITIEPTAENGLRLKSDIMADKPVTVARRRVGPVIGRLSDQDIQRLNIALQFALGLRG
ncbi:type II toxin-antitoxin system PemK/MazF family toxin [Neorhizobium galegae]|uniref:type II toxin-antitoxin system PemK/MazF family toxin n=1 Tax=Neorhizobium galegae TaxID=399 RepID=UPI0006226CBE|nr:type II toxin-antitoxin system PemK/MazF family toxin [Neorhizobium galegae]MCQ1766344.1 type II toxin-antitoxin system PemK/MazF family toxin [Neorhizobium galegae]MCQ1845258.1 type II toxin-antitoxin system PemK/MazF family toxin [Neorhizobium galegae]CDZ36535.1 Growth inhibitor [Neorhizobium galegae bv. officinalis]